MLPLYAGWLRGWRAVITDMRGTRFYDPAASVAEIIGPPLDAMGIPRDTGSFTFRTFLPLEFYDELPEVWPLPPIC
jgi:hypothetical protein